MGVGPGEQPALQAVGVGSGVTSQLPQSSTAEEMPHPKLVVTLIGDDTLAIDDHTISAAELTQRLRDLADPTKATVTIAGAKTASAQGLLAVMDACRTAGIAQVGIAAQEAH